MNLDDLVIISVDDHVVEPATMFDHHLSAEHLALAPRYVCDEEGSYSWWWAHENKRPTATGSMPWSVGPRRNAARAGLKRLAHRRVVRRPSGSPDSAGNPAGVGRTKAHRLVEDPPQ